MLFSTLKELKTWNLQWPPHEPGPWELNGAGIDKALSSKPAAIGVYWIGYSPDGRHFSRLLADLHLVSDRR